MDDTFENADTIPADEAPKREYAGGALCPAGHWTERVGAKCNQCPRGSKTRGVTPVGPAAAANSPRAAPAEVTLDLAMRRSDDLPLASAREPDDPGVAVYYRRSGRDHVLACDAYKIVGGNLAAIAHTIGALRGIARWRCMSVDEAIAGSRLALPGEIQVARPWREVIGGAWPEDLDRADLLAIAKRRYRARVAEVHPDSGGDAAAAAELNGAMAEAELELGGAR